MEEILEAKQKEFKVAQHKLIQDVQTRWNSTYLLKELSGVTYPTLSVVVPIFQSLLNLQEPSDTDSEFKTLFSCNEKSSKTLFKILC